MRSYKQLLLAGCSVASVATAHLGYAPKVMAQDRQDKAATQKSDKLAVSAPNVRLGAGAGANDGQGFGYAEGSAAVPLGERFGFQVDAIAGAGNNDGFAGIAGHLFHRNPEFGSIGLYGSFLHSTGEHSNGAITENGYSEGKIAAEGQLYLDRVTVEALAGVDWNSLEESFKPFIEGKFTFYPTNNFRMGAGLRYRGAFGGRTQFVGNAEYLTNLGNARSASLYGQFEVDLNDSDISSSGDYSIMAGLRFYFGGATRPGTEDRGRSLIERDREDLMPIYFTGDAGHLPPRRDKFLPPVVPPGPPDGPPGPPDGPPGPPDGPPGPPGGPPSGPPGGG